MKWKWRQVRIPKKQSVTQMPKRGTHPEPEGILTTVNELVQWPQGQTGTSRVRPRAPRTEEQRGEDGKKRWDENKAAAEGRSLIN